MRQYHLENLHDMIRGMDLPYAKKVAVSDVDLRWLGRNMFFKNRHHDNFDTACDILEDLEVKLVIRGK